MNIGAILVLAKLFQDAVGVSPLVIGPPAPNDKKNGALCYRPDGYLTWLCYLEHIDPAASYMDYQDYLKGN